MSVQISVHKSNRKCINLARFSNGSIKRKYADELQVDILSRKNCTNPRLKEHKILVAETNQMSYVGKNFGEITANKVKGLCKYYVGVLDPETSKMRIMDTEKFLLQPHIPGRDNELDAEAAPTPAVSMSEKKDMLISAFGSAKRRRAMESRLRHHVEKDVLEGALNIAVDKGLSQAQVYKEAAGNDAKDWEQSLIPPYNLEAKTEQEAYKLEDIISSKEMDMLTTSAQPFVECNATTIQEWRKSEKYPTYVLNHLATMPLNPKPREHRAICLLYVHYMMHLFSLRSHQIRLKDPLPNTWPAPIKRKLLDSFTRLVQAGKRTNRCFPGSLKDKLLNYILTVCLIIDEFSIDLSDIMRDLKIGNTKLDTHVRALGCVTSKRKVEGEVKQMAILKVPLKFSEARNKKQKK